MTIMSKDLTKRTNQPEISIVEKYGDYCVLLLTRGFGGPQEIIKWLHRQEESSLFHNTTTATAVSTSSEGGNDDDNDVNHITELAGHMTINGNRSDNSPKDELPLASQAVMVSPHCKAYARGLVLVAKDKIALQNVKQVQLTIQCLCQGYIEPSDNSDETQQVLEHVFDGKQSCRLQIQSLQVARSNALGYITLIEATNLPTTKAKTNETLVDGTTIHPRQFRRQLKAAGFPILGHTKDCHQFRGDKLCMSVVKLHFQTITATHDDDGDNESAPYLSETVIIDPIPRFKVMMEREEKFWTEKESRSQPCDTVGAEPQASRDNHDQHGVHQRPAAYISGHATFDGLQFLVSPAVMIPRPGSEAIVRRAVQLYKEQAQSKEPFILDLGLGSGCLLLSLLKRFPQALGFGIDKSKDALQVAKQNAVALGLASRCTLKEGDFSQLDQLGFDFGDHRQKFDIIVCNPPYHTRGGRQQINASSVAHEPSMAMYVEYGDMTIHYRNVLEGLKRANLVHTGTVLVFEVCRDNAKHVANLMKDIGLDRIQIGKDDNNLLRTAEGIFIV